MGRAAGRDACTGPRWYSVADLPRLAGPDQEALRDLRTPRPSVEALPRSYTGEAVS